MFYGAALLIGILRFVIDPIAAMSYVLMSFYFVLLAVGF